MMKFLLSLTFSTMLIAAFAGSVLASDDNPDTGSEAASEVSESQADESGVSDEAADQTAAIWEQPLDGTSVESFQAGLAQVEQEVSEAEYRELMSSISFLLFYDLGAKRDKATLYSRLDGKSPRQITERVQSHRSGKR